MNTNNISINKDSFFISAQTEVNKFQTFETFLSWFDSRLNNNFKVEEIPFSKVEQWSFTDNKESLVHQSGKFFRIEGIEVNTNFGKTNSWQQPIINQPEIGILGIITKVFDGVRYFLMQSKMEPGNINILQLSPTVQATKSNFSRVHQGKLPPYLEYFITYEKSKVIYDQLQTEQGGRFLKKRNRNIIIEVEEDIEIYEDFCWLTLAEIKKLLSIDNFVNMDARSVISIIPFLDDHDLESLNKLDFKNNKEVTINEKKYSGLDLELLISACTAITPNSSKDIIISWYTSMKVNYELKTKKIPLTEVKNWEITENAIKSDDRFFSVIGVRVEAGTREVTSWCQPLVKDLNIGLLGFILKKIDGVIHFLVQAKVEPGNIDVIELSPSVSCSNYEHILKNRDKMPPFFEHFFENEKATVLIDSLQSEEGGRFFHLQNRNKIILLPEDTKIEIPENYCWMTINQMSEFMRYSMFNIEARSLISCLNLNN